VATERDASSCRDSAEQQGVRRYPYGSGSPALGGAGAMMSQQRDEMNRSNTEQAAFNACMRGLGYRRASAKGQ